MRVDAKQELITEHLGLGINTELLTTIGMIVVHVSKRRECLRQLLNIQVRIVPVRVRRRRCRLAQLVFG